MQHGGVVLSPWFSMEGGNEPCFGGWQRAMCYKVVQMQPMLRAVDVSVWAFEKMASNKWGVIGIWYREVRASAAWLNSQALIQALFSQIAALSRHETEANLTAPDAASRSPVAMSPANQPSCLRARACHPGE
jgi:hypothetical protein